MFRSWRQKSKVPSSAAFGQIALAYLKALCKIAERHDTPTVYWQKGQNKQEVACPHLEAAAAGNANVGWVLIGIAQRDGFGVATVAELRAAFSA